MSAGTTIMVQGRLVWTSGNLFTGKLKTEYGTQTPKLNKAGEQMKEYGFGLAVPKTDLTEVWNALHQEAYTLYPNRQIPPAFAMKYKDGDGIDDKGQPFANREGYAGHMILACTTSLSIKYFKHEAGANIMINEGIKCGDYVNVQLTIKAHPAIGQGKPGLYLNPNAVQLLGYGKEIINTPSGDQIFGAAAPSVPAEASATPIVPPQGHAQLVPAPGQPVVAPAHYGVLPPVHQPQSAAQPVPPPVQPVAPQPVVAPVAGPPAFNPAEPLPNFAPAAPVQQPVAPGGMPPIPQ